MGACFYSPLLHIIYLSAWCYYILSHSCHVDECTNLKTLLSLHFLTLVTNNKLHGIESILRSWWLLSRPRNFLHSVKAKVLLCIHKKQTQNATLRSLNQVQNLKLYLFKIFFSIIIYQYVYLLLDLLQSYFPTKM
jgi:hypothetical protein